MNLNLVNVSDNEDEPFICLSYDVLKNNVHDIQISFDGEHGEDNSYIQYRIKNVQTILLIKSLRN